MFNRNIKLHASLKESLQSIYFRDIPLPWIILGIQCFENFKPLSEFRVFFKKRTELNICLFDHIQKVQNKIKCTSLEFNYESHNEPTIKQSFPKILYKEGNNMKIIKAREMLLQISEDQEEIIYKTQDFLVFSHFTKLKLKDVSVAEKSDSNLFRTLSKHKVNIKHSCFVITNKNFDELKISTFDEFLTLNPYGCNLLKLVINEEYRGLRYLKVLNFFK